VERKIAEREESGCNGGLGHFESFSIERMRKVAYRCENRGKAESSQREGITKRNEKKRGIACCWACLRLCIRVIARKFWCTHLGNLCSLINRSSMERRAGSRDRLVNAF
jgi:hypothetical protein